MFRMEPRTELIHFEHKGVKYAMTRAEIDAAAAFVERENREEDALSQLNYFIFGYDGPAFGDNPEDAEASEAEDLAAFEEQYEISYLDARKLKTHFAAVFMSCTDCNRAENDLWHDAIACVLNTLKPSNQPQS